MEREVLFASNFFHMFCWKNYKRPRRRQYLERSAQLAEARFTISKGNTRPGCVGKVANLFGSFLEDGPGVLRVALLRLRVRITRLYAYDLDFADKLFILQVVVCGAN